MKMNIHKDKMLWYNTKYCISTSYELLSEEDLEEIFNL